MKIKLGQIEALTRCDNVQEALDRDEMLRATFYALKVDVARTSPALTLVDEKYSIARFPLGQELSDSSQKIWDKFVEDLREHHGVELPFNELVTRSSQSISASQEQSRA